MIPTLMVISLVLVLIYCHSQALHGRTSIPSKLNGIGTTLEVEMPTTLRLLVWRGDTMSKGGEAE